MRFLLGFLVLGLFVAIAAWTVSAQTDSAAQDHPAGHGMGMGGGRMDMMNMPDEMKQKCRMMMQTAINPSDPAAILAMKDELKLTPDQVQKLQGIVEKARQEAKGVLNEQQAKMLEAIPAQPETSMGMHQHMMQMMRRMHGGQGDGQMPMMNCPMMNMMGGAATTQRAQDPPATPQDHEAHHR